MPENNQPRVEAADYSLTPSKLVPVLRQLASMPSKRPVMLWGPPGVGKSWAAMEAAKAMDAEFIDVRPLTMDPVDLRGIPVVNGDGKTRWATPGFLPDEKSDEDHVICLEELTSAPPSMQAALYQLVWDRRLGEYSLPEGAYVLAAGNRVSDRGVAHRMPTPLARRFIHIDVSTDSREWVDWAMDHGIAEEVIMFIMVRPDLLEQFDPRSTDNTGPCPRTWHMVSDLMEARAGTDPHVFRSLLKGTVGEGPAIEFHAFLDIYNDLPLPETVLANPDEAPVFADKPSTLLALCGSIMRIAERDNFGQVIRYAERIRPEVAQFLVGSCIRRNPDLEKTLENVRWISKSQI